MLTTIKQVFNQEQLTIIRERLEDANWLDGKSSAGLQAQAVKANLQLDESTELYQQLCQAVMKALSNNEVFVSASLANKIYPPKFNCYANGGAYGEHIDSAILELGQGQRMRSDLAATLFFDEPESYTGGELLINAAYGQQSVKLAAGDMVLYPADTLHQVKTVSKGQRRCAFFWVESLVRDAKQREMLFDLDQTIQRLRLQQTANHNDADESAEIKKLTGLYHNLLRTWAVS